MIALWAAILGSSLAGSLHCVAMCGPLVGLHGGARSLRLALIHALGRLTTYGALGALAGLVGSAVDVAGHLAAVQHVAAIVAGGAIVGWGVRAIAVAAGWITVQSSGGALFQRGLVQIRGRRPAGRAWLVGVLTGLLPCGWLWAFVVSAAGTASPVAGALVMAVFWLGTVPAMTGVLALGGAVLDAMRRRMPVISAGILIVLGLATLAGRWADAGATGATAPHCHRSAP
ncbi:MAG: sulfite exporter TauE/SafE family protein [Deltaproteobacteria bacterium]|nr:MAG: sulfite exporter TauE/SafE family protein [Deltaproteobacteria bacterium]